LSAVTGAGLDLLLQAITEYFNAHNVDRWLRLRHDTGRLRAKVYSMAEVLDERHGEQGEVLLHVRLSERNLGYLQKHDGVEEDLPHVLVAGAG
jgi:GTP-binding protein HflX